MTPLIAGHPAVTTVTSIEEMQSLCTSYLAQGQAVLLSKPDSLYAVYRWDGSSGEAADGDSVVAGAGAFGRFIRQGAKPAGTHAVYVSKEGIDTNTGLSDDQSKPTIGAAMTTASALIVAGAPRVAVRVLDGGTYTEEVTVPAGVSLLAEAATIAGTVETTGGGEIVVNTVEATANNQVLLAMGAGTAGAADVHVKVCDGRGFTGVANIENKGGSGRNFFVYTGRCYVGEDGTGVGDVTNGFGHIHLHIPDLYLAGDNAVGVLGTANGANGSNIIGFIDHILEIDSPTGTTGIQVDDANAVVRLTANQILADTAFNVSDGSLYLNCLNVTGTETHTGGTVVRSTLSTTTI